MSERHDATTSNSSMHERIERRVSTNRQLQMPRRNTLDAQILRRSTLMNTHTQLRRQKERRTCQFQHGREVFKMAAA